MKHSIPWALGIALAAAFALASAASAPTAITPFIQVNGGSWQQTNTASVASGSRVNLAPQPLTGTWSWSGPGGFSSSARQINNIPLNVGTDTYTATYTNASGAKSTETFTIRVSGSSCSATAITPYVYVNGAWHKESSASVNSTSATVDLAPQPLSGGSWSWSGPKGFTSRSREIDNIKLSAGTNTYTATYTNSCGAKSTKAFTITAPSSTCTATAIVPYIFVNNAWVEETSASVTSTSAMVDLGPQALSGGSWSWSGPKGFTSRSREIDNIKLGAGTNTYTATYTNSCGAKSTKGFTVTVSAAKGLAPGDYNETITSVGESRQFILHIPTGYTGNTAMPAILDFHPFGVDDAYMEGMSGWKEKCDTEGCIVVYPNGVNESWNAGYCCGGGPDDVQFARDIITWLKAHTNLDAKRVYASGGSNGGAMAYALACKASDVIAAIAAVDFRCVTGSDPGAGGAKMSPENNTACVCPNLKRPITVVEWEEQQDTSFVLYQGGVASTGLGLVGAVANIETFGYWSGCKGSPTPDPDNSLCKTWTSCKNGVTETICNHQSGSHLATYWDSSDHWNDVSWERMRVQSLP